MARRKKVPFLVLMSWRWPTHPPCSVCGCSPRGCQPCLDVPGDGLILGPQGSSIEPAGDWLTHLGRWPAGRRGTGTTSLGAPAGLCRQPPSCVVTERQRHEGMKRLCRPRLADLPAPVTPVQFCVSSNGHKTYQRMNGPAFPITAQSPVVSQCLLFFSRDR